MLNLKKHNRMWEEDFFPDLFCLPDSEDYEPIKNNLHETLDIDIYSKTWDIRMSIIKFDKTKI